MREPPTTGDESEEAEGPDAPWDPGSLFGLAFFLFVLAAGLYFFASVVALGGDVNPRPTLKTVLAAGAIVAFLFSVIALLVGLGRKRWS